MLPKMKKNSKHMKYIRTENKRKHSKMKKGIYPRSFGQENKLSIINGCKQSVAERKSCQKLNSSRIQS